MEHFEVEDGRVTPGFEEVLAQAEIASEAPLLLSVVGEAMFDGDALALRGASGARGGEIAQAPLERLVGGDGEGAPMAESGGGADDAERAGGALLRIESGDLAESDGY